MRVLVGVLLLTLVSLTATVWTCVKHGNRKLENEFALESLHGQIALLDEQLTMAVRMAAWTGDLNWKDRYELSEKSLGLKLRHYDQLLATFVGSEMTEAHAAISNASAINERLVELETTCFQKVQDGDLASAANLVVSDNYKQLRQRYAGALAESKAEVNRQVAKVVEKNRQESMIVAAGGLLTAGAMMLGILLLASRHRLQMLVRLKTSARLAAVAERTSNAVVVTNVAGRIEWTNEGFTRLTGYALDEVQGRTPGEILQGPRTDPAEVARIRAAVRAGESVSGELVNYTKDGRAYVVRIEIKPLRDNMGQVTGFMAIESDITEARYASDAVRLERERLALALESGGLGSWDWNIETGEVVYDERWATMLGEERVDAHLDTWSSRVHPDDLPMVLAKLEAHLQGETHKFECLFRMRHKDGSWRWIIDRGLIVERNAHGSPVRMVGTHADVTERIQKEQDLKESERFARSTVDALSAHLAILDENGRIIAVNRAWREFAENNQCPIANVCEGTNYLAVCQTSQAHHSSEAGVVEAGIRAIMRGEREEFSLEYPCHGPKERRWFVVRATRFAGTGPVRVVVVHENITQRKLAEIDLARASESAKAANRAKSEFLANMSHEIRTPLTAILGFTELLAEGDDDAITTAQRLEAVSTIQRAGEHLLTIVNDILDLSKIEAGQMTVERVETDLVDLLLGVESLMRPRAAGKGLTLDIELDTALPCRALTDPTRLRQVLLNLVGNAVKFTDQGGVRIHVSAEQQPEGDSLLRAAIHDSGPGLTPEQEQRLFAAFSQADPTVTRKHGGSGLGLIICRRLSQLMGGSVELTTTQPGRGSIFTVTVRIGQVPCAGETRVLTRHVSPSTAALTSKVAPLNGRILLAEDGPDNQRLISIILKRAGAQVDIAENGEVAWRMLEEANAIGTPYDMLLTDIQMPVMDGYTLAGKVRERGWQLPVVALTAHAMPEERQRCLEAGCKDFTTKPIDKRSLLTICQRWMPTASPVA